MRDFLITTRRVHMSSVFIPCIVFLVAIALLSGCSNKLPPLSKSEAVQISAYLPWPRSYLLKSAGDWALLDNGESLQIESTKWAAIIGKTALPIPSSRIEKDRAAWEKNMLILQCRAEWQQSSIGKSD